jgi:hypothetical protein
LLDPVWTPDERARALRRSSNRREAHRARPDALQERGAWCAVAQSVRARAGDRRVRQGRPGLARRLELPVDDDVLFGYRLQFFALAAEREVSEACRVMGVHRSTY